MTPAETAVERLGLISGERSEVGDGWKKGQIALDATATEQQRKEKNSHCLSRMQPRTWSHMELARRETDAPSHSRDQ